MICFIMCHSVFSFIITLILSNWLHTETSRRKYIRQIYVMLWVVRNRILICGKTVARLCQKSSSLCPNTHYKSSRRKVPGWFTTSAEILKCTQSQWKIIIIRPSLVLIRWTLYSPMRPQEWQWSDATYTGRSPDSNNMANVVYDRITFIYPIHRQSWGVTSYM